MRVDKIAEVAWKYQKMPQLLKILLYLSCCVHPGMPTNHLMLHVFMIYRGRVVIPSGAGFCESVRVVCNVSFPGVLMCFVLFF